ncbi:hypothetical protein Hanom_Chr04g00347611 [Helianthus anomalus]
MNDHRRSGDSIMVGYSGSVVPDSTSFFEKVRFHMVKGLEVVGI